MSRETPMRGQAQASQRARSYSYNQHGRQTRGMMGDHVIRKGAGVEVWKPSWKGTTTTLRLFPALCPENPAEWDPWRFSGEDDDYGDWIRTYPAVRNFGDPGVTFVLYDPTDQAYDAQGNPAWILYNAITRALDAGTGDPKWVPYTKGSTGRGAALKRPQDITVLQGAILQHNNKDYDPPRGGAANDSTCVIELSNSAAQAMLEAMNERRPEFRGDPDDYQGMFVHGDPIAINHGAFINFYQLGQDPRERMQVNEQRRGSSFGQARPTERGGGGRGNDEPIGYGCFLTPTYKGMPADLTGVEDLIRKKFKPWDEVIQILDTEQQIRLLSGAFPADMIIYAFQDTHRELIPESVWRAYQNRSQAPTGGQLPQQPAAPAGQRRGWGAPAPDASAGQGTGPVAGADDGYDDGAPVDAEPQSEAPAAPAGQPAQPPVAGQRRGWGGTAATNNETVIGETAPREELPDQAPAPRQAAPPVGFDQRPAAGAPAPSGNAVQSAIAASRERVQRRRQGPDSGQQ